jgi:hypothetical protein
MCVLAERMLEERMVKVPLAWLFISIESILRCGGIVCMP